MKIKTWVARIYNRFRWGKQPKWKRQGHVLRKLNNKKAKRLRRWFQRT